MLPRFDGDQGRKRLAEILTRQPLIAGDKEVARLLADAAELIEAPPGTAITEQGGADDDIYFIVSGTVSITVNGRVVTTRAAGTHIGEMAVADPTARRSATTTAQEPCLLAKVAAVSFSAIAEAHPGLWRAIAVETASRFRERNKHIRQPHNQPIVFVGSTSERLDIPEQIQLGLSHQPFVIKLWKDGIFTASKTTIESLMKMVGESDFAVICLTPDDTVTSRGTETPAPRDNLLFELGLFMGGIGVERTFIVHPRGVDIKIPTDIMGITCITYAEGSVDSLESRIAPVCTQLHRLINEKGPR
ncbi:TIR domain-containing protein [Cupriavidus sp. AcVe19-1a]|uniref:TIR domain-containing protein n=1 Tax=Cupriavidus sp. AcVe19-1a TaxID=2821359 RepID=UPI001AE36D17|nr:TIR domain-containing protein [Cupriavidus sp. AcVe19-1a]MBP0631980.1 nucleotide-binding protein [Cupriavidus sp. AcVe19-1a]